MGHPNVYEKNEWMSEWMDQMSREMEMLYYDYEKVQICH